MGKILNRRSIIMENMEKRRSRNITEECDGCYFNRGKCTIDFWGQMAPYKCQKETKDEDNDEEVSPKFCPGCGKMRLKRSSDFKHYETPCTLYEGYSEKRLRSMFEGSLTAKEMDAMVEWYDSLSK